MPWNYKLSSEQYVSNLSFHAVSPLFRNRFLRSRRQAQAANVADDAVLTATAKITVEYGKINAADALVIDAGRCQGLGTMDSQRDFAH